MIRSVQGREQELIREYREYDEDKDPGGHRYSSIIAKLSKISGFKSVTEIEQWVSEHERGNGLNSSAIPYESDTTAQEDEGIMDSETIQMGRRRLEEAVANATDPKKKVFFEELLNSLDNL